MLNGPRDILELYNKRRDYYQASIAKKTEMVGVWHNKMPDRGLKYWRSPANPNANPEVYLNNIKRSWQDFMQMTSKVLPIYVPPRSNAAANKKAAEKVEDICYGYNSAGLKRGGLGMKALMDVLSWWLVGTSDAVAIVYPDYQRQTPFFHWRDSRTHLPPEGWTPYSQVPLEGTLLTQEATLGELQQRYPDSAARLDAVYNNDSGPAVYQNGRWTKYDKNSKIPIGEFYHSDAWYVCTLQEQSIILVQSETGDPGHPGVQPVVPLSMYSPNDPKGLSMYDEQVDLDVQVSRMFSQFLDGFDRVNNPRFFISETVSGTIQEGPGGITVLSTVNGEKPFVHESSPNNPSGPSQMIQMALALSNRTTRSPESMQGQGQANSAKALNELKSGPEGTVQDYFWPAFIQGLPKLYKAAAQMDINLWGNVKKTAAGRKNNHTFSTDYTPNVHLKGYEEDIQIEPGLGLGGYQGTIEIMQRLGAELISMDDALEALPDVRDPQATRRRIEGDRLDKTMWMQAEAQAQQGALQPTAFHDLKELVDEKDMSISEGIAELTRQGKWLVPPQAAPEAPVTPGMPPQMAQQAPALPSLRELRSA